MGGQHRTAGRGVRGRRAASAIGVSLLLATGLAGPAQASAPTVRAAPAAATTTAPTTNGVPAKAAPWRWRHYVGQRVAWSPSSCSADARRLSEAVRELNARSRIECARLRTPLDWRDLSKGSGSLQVTRVTRTIAKGDKRATRTLFVNPGGPGVTADWLPSAVATLEPQVARTHQIVAVDVRGTGGSMPVACRMADGGVRDRRTTSAAGIAAQQRAAQATVRACAKAKPSVLPRISTQQTIRDHDLVRSLLKAPKVDYFGVSAGTWLGARYAEAYPGRVGRFVLDSNTEFSADWRTSFAWQPMGFQRRFDQQFLPWVARHHDEYRLGTTTAKVRAAYASLRSAVAAGRVRGLTTTQFDDQVAESMYDDSGFLDLASALSELSAGRAKGGRAAAAFVAAERDAQASGSTEDTVFMAVQCNDSRWSRSPASYVAEGLRQGSRYPLIGYLWLTSPCAYWPYAPQVAPKPATGARPTMLMVQTELDAATPYEGAGRAHAATPGTRLVTVDNQGNHGAYLGENPCVERAVTGFLTTGRLPSRDTVCAGVPLPGDAKTYAVGPASAATATARPKADSRIQQRVRDTTADRIAEVSDLGH